MAKKSDQNLFFREQAFNVDDSGFLSGEVTYELHGIPNTGSVIHAFIELQKGGKVCLVSEVSQCYLTETDNVFSVYFSGQLDGNALPDSFQLQYRLSICKDIIKAEPSLPSNMGSALLTTPPKSILGRSKWRASSGNRVESIFVHNQEGQFSVSSAIAVGKNWEKTSVVVRYSEDESNTLLFDSYRTPSAYLEEHYAEGSEVLICEYFLFEADQWRILPPNSGFEISRVN